MLKYIYVVVDDVIKFVDTSIRFNLDVYNEALEKAIQEKITNEDFTTDPKIIAMQSSPYGENDEYRIVNDAYYFHVKDKLEGLS